MVDCRHTNNDAHMVQGPRAAASMSHLVKRIDAVCCKQGKPELNQLIS